MEETIGWTMTRGLGSSLSYVPIEYYNMYIVYTSSLVHVGGSAPKREPLVANGDLGYGVVATAAFTKSDGGRSLRLLGCLAAGVDFDGWLHDC